MAKCVCENCVTEGGYACSKCGQQACSKHMSTNVGQYDYLCHVCDGAKC